MTFRERMQWIFRMALLAFILASVAFLSALTAMRFAIQGREVSMPDLVGMKSSQAQLILQGRKLGMTVEDRTFNNLPVDSVVRQSPAANTRVKTGQSAHVVLSSGLQNATIPQLEDTSLRTARIELGDIVAVIGLGLVGQLVAQLVRVQGGVVIGIDLNPQRVDLAKSLGARAVKGGARRSIGLGPANPRRMDGEPRRSGPPATWRSTRCSQPRLRAGGGR